MKYFVPLLLSLASFFQSSGQCDIFFEDSKVIQNDYREMVDIGPGNLGFTGNRPMQVKNPATEMDWFDVSFARGIWTGGYDPVGNLHLAASAYGLTNSESDYVCGPIMQSDSCSFFERAWVISGHEIATLRSKFDNGTLFLEDIPENIIEWPAKDNPHIGSLAPDYDMAPFYDSDQDGAYDPMTGDYPIALQENPEFIPYQMAFTVFNDLTLHSESFADPMSMEFHQIDYVVSCSRSSESETSVYTRLKYLYRGLEPLSEFKFGIWDDTDLGFSGNDYAGCLPSANSTYVYNQNGIDAGTPGPNLVIPDNTAVVKSLVLLNDDLNSFIFHRRNGVGSPDPATTDPSSANHYYSYLCAKWMDGLPITVGGNGYDPMSTDETVFAFPDLPTDANGWSMEQVFFPASDIRTVTNVTMKDELLPGESHTIDFVDHVMIDQQNLGLSIFNNYETRINNLKAEFEGMLDGSFDCGDLVTICENDCVWPGDVDDNGVVEGKDIVLLGNLLGAGITEGIARPIRSSEWFGWASEDWSEEFIGINGKYADASGNGKLNGFDLDASYKNWGLSRVVDGPDIVLEERAGDVQLSMLSLKDTIDMDDLQPIPFFGTLVEYNLYIGDNAGLLDEPIHGLSFDIKVDTTLMAFTEAPATLTNNFDTQDFYYLGEDYDRDLDELLGENTMHFAYTNIDGNEIDSRTHLGTVRMRARESGMTINPDRRDTVVLKFQNVFATNAAGEVIDLGASYHKLFLSNLTYNPDLISSVEPGPNNFLFQLFPNPVQDQLNLNFNKEVKGQVGIYTMDGQLQRQQEIESRTEIDIRTADLAAGLYICRYTDINGMTASKKFVKME